MFSSKVATLDTPTGKLPTLYPGDVTPLVLNDMEMHFINYFDTKDIDEKRHVRLALGCFQDTRAKNWFRPPAERKRLIELPFEAFMLEAQTKFLKASWKSDTRNEILSARMPDTNTFAEWSTHVESLNSLLIGTEHALDETRIRHTLEAGMPAGLRTLVNDKKTGCANITKYSEWIMEVIVLDNKRVADDEHHRMLILEAVRAEKRKAAEDSDRVSKKPNSKPASTASTSASTSSTSANKKTVPTLDLDERKLLEDNNGCTRCRRFFVGHRHRDCNNPWPDADTYQHLTQAHVDHAKQAMRAASKGKGKANAATSTTSTPAIAAIMAPVEFDSDDSCDSEQDLSRNVSKLTSNPHSVPHLFWDCLVEGPMSNLPLHSRALIDNGCHLVVIDEDLADKLDLRCFKLREPEDVSLAFSPGPDSERSTTSLHEYVKLHPLSCDQSWTSHTVRALVAPNLCAPLILGLPFLSRNHIVIDHESRTAVDKCCQYDLLNPPAVKPPPVPKMKLREKLEVTDLKPVDVIAAVRERVEVLSHYEELSKRADKIRADYARLFEPMPHAKDLPSDVLCEISVKDANMTFKSRSYQSPRKYQQAWQ
ncbi:hypothetical protein C8R43DRAFT_882239, partial [Mycena crocata]